MADKLNGRKRIRKQFGSIAEVARMPNLIEVQKSSYDEFLMVKEPSGGREDQGLQAVFRSVFPIMDFPGRSTLELVRYDFEPPKYDVDECQQRDMTYAAPLKVKLRLIVFDVNANIDLSIWMCVIVGVIDQICKNLANPLWVSRYTRKTWRHFKINFHRFAIFLRLPQLFLDNLACDLGDI